MTEDNVNSVVEVESSFFVDLDDTEPLNGLIDSIVWGTIPFGIAMFFTFFKDESMPIKVLRGCFVFESIDNYSFPIINFHEVIGVEFDYISEEVVTDSRGNHKKYSIPVYNYNNGRYEIMEIESTDIRCFYSKNAYVSTEDDYVQNTRNRYLYFEKFASDHDFYDVYWKGR